MYALRLPGGAPVRSNPPWNRQRPVGWFEGSSQGAPSRVRAPQMRRPSFASAASTRASQAESQDLAVGVPRAVVLQIVD
jgi:hypothetical protein